MGASYLGSNSTLDITVALGIRHRGDISYAVYTSYILKPWRTKQNLKDSLTLGKLNGSLNLYDLIINGCLLSQPPGPK